jgi:hypothetical protein
MGFFSSSYDLVQEFWTLCDTEVVDPKMTVKGTV